MSSFRQSPVLYQKLNIFNMSLPLKKDLPKTKIILGQC